MAATKKPTKPVRKKPTSAKKAAPEVSQSRVRKAQLARQEAFLKAYERLCHVSQAADAAGIERRIHYHWLAHDPTYPPRFATSDAMAVAALEDELLRRAMHGVDEPVFHQGEVCGTVRKFSDRLGEFLLKGRKPQVYGDRFKSEVTGANGAPIQVAGVGQFLLEELVAIARGGNESE